MGRDYYGNTRSEILDRLGGPVFRMLDVGCGRGEFATACKAKFGCETWGVEHVESAANDAKGVLDHAECGDALEVMRSLPDKHFDMIAFTDVLEHLADPVAALREAKRLMGRPSRLVASLPNIRYARALRTILLDGDFPMESEGIFDRTHLHFFTRKSIPRIFDEAGFVITDLVGINPTGSRAFRILNALTLSKFEDCRYLQYLVMATPRV